MQRFISIIDSWFGSSGEVAGCAVPRSPIVPGVSRVADVGERFGTPGMVWRNADGTVTWEYADAFDDDLCYMIRAGIDDVVLSVELAVSEVRFAQVRAGMNGTEVRRLMGRPVSSHYRPDTHETVWRWYIGRRADGEAERTFAAWFDQDGQVVRTKRVVE